MNKYLVLYHSEGALNGPSVAEMFANTPPERLKTGSSGSRNAAPRSPIRAPLDKSTAVKSGDAARAGSTMTGFSMLQAGSTDEAVALVKDHPHFRAPGASVQILECVRMPGMWSRGTVTATAAPRTTRATTRRGSASSSKSRPPTRGALIFRAPPRRARPILPPGARHAAL